MDANLVSGEQEQLENNLIILKNSEEIRTALVQINSLLYSDENSIENKIIQLNSILSNISKFSNNYLEIKNRIESVLIELDDIKSELNSPSTNFDNDSFKLENIENRLSVIYNLQKKHSVNSIAELITKTNKLQLQLEENDNIGIDIENLKKEISLKESLIGELSVKISNSRKKILPKLKLELESIMLTKWKMLHFYLIFMILKFIIVFDENIKVLFSSNIKINDGPLNKVASGGELSRIMLSIKAVLSSHSKLPTMIFDEIDTGYFWRNV